MSGGGSFQRVRSSYDLPTYQKRLRHLRSVAVRNLVGHKYHGTEVTKMQSFFTLHRDESSKAFYTSEHVTGSVNPTWKSFDISRYEPDINLKSKFVVLRVWVGQEEKYMLLMDLTVHLSGLDFFTDKLQHRGMKYNPNSVIFGMFDKYFVAMDEARQPLEERQLSIVTQRSLSSGDTSFVFKVDQSAIRGSYTASSITRIQTILRATKQTQATVNKIHTAIEDRLLSSQETALKLCKREQLLMKIAQLRSELTWQTSRLQMDKDKFDQVKSDNSQKSSDFGEQESNLTKSKRHHDDTKKTYFQSRESLVKENAQLMIRRKQLVGEMSTYIYPISENQKKQLNICCVWLPNAEDYQGQDETMVAVALGYTCHLTMMISQFLDLPLRYALEHRGSKSQIRDHIHNKLTDKDRDFPLYSKGKEKFQFNYGVFLINKNISQLRFCCGLGTTDLRLTLPNVKSLLELRLGVKLDGLTARSLTPTSGTGNSITSSAARDSTRSLAGSSSASSLARKEEVITSQQYDSANNGNQEYPNENTNNSDQENKENRKRGKTKEDFDESVDIFEGNDDDFFKVRSSFDAGTDSSVLDDSNKVNSEGDEMLIEQGHKLNDMEAVKATLQIHFDASDGSSSPSISIDEEVSSGEEKAQHMQLGHQKSLNINTDLADLMTSDLPVTNTFKTTAFRTLEHDSSSETALTEDFINTTKVVS